MQNAMNSQLRSFAISRIREGLENLNDGCNQKFARMYPKPLEELTDEQLNCAMDQVARSLKKEHLLRAKEEPT